MSLLTLGLAAGAAAGVYATLIEPSLLCVREPVAISRWWPSGRPCLRIGVIADLHACWPLMSAARVERIATRLLAAGPDLVLLPGDFVSTHTWFVRPIAVEAVAAALRGLAAAVPTFAVLGNHDWYYGGERVAAALADVGIPVLRNAATRVALAGGDVWIAGIDDAWTRRDDLERALRETDGTAPIILLSHVPDPFRQMPPGIALAVAGHTHGGQVCVPGYGPLRTVTCLPRRLAYGLSAEGGRHLYVSGGVGTTALPVRFARPPEIALLTLAGAV